MHKKQLMNEDQVKLLLQYKVAKYGEIISAMSRIGRSSGYLQIALKLAIEIQTLRKVLGSP
jgi:hypothetical protein